MIKNKGIIISILIILIVFISMIAATYSVIINVASNNGINEIVNEITVRDLMIDNNGEYNNTYYEVKRELNITLEEANILINSKELDKQLQIVLKSIVSYKVDGDINSKLSDDEIYNLIVEGVNKDSNISSSLRNKVINKSQIYIRDVSNFLYDIDVNILGNR
jgi:hypothetical protein